MTEQPTCWINGEPSSQLETSDRGLAYGHGLFETMRVCDGAAPLLHYHLERLHIGAQVLGIPVEQDALEKQLATFLKKHPEAGIIKILVTAGCGGRGYQMPEPLTPNIVLQWHPLAVQTSQELRLRLCQHRLPNNPPLAGIKHLNRLDQIIARQEWSGSGESSDWHEGILLDTQGRPVEAVASNLFVWLRGAWVTPKLHRCGVAGVMRRVIMDQLCPALGIDVVERDMHKDELAKASEMILCNSVQGIRSVASVNQLVDYQENTQGQQLRRTLGEQYACFRC
ncbi:aminodeoxychorismate lyase [Porticoccus sp. W117]|uniref:aminodeoxychorismate lyase n=1 Tax=Porticoccus sp. W117 TaxID=3054777 RepID=UPI0025969BFA|nr:aminodeoxychorismate lyase [Porticoccus sp. W117]MDM3869732.1 aminodeoxychorismate lyase [Porticoccus sp. W117]